MARVFRIEEGNGEETGIEGYRLIEKKKFLGLFNYETDDIRLTFGHSIRYFSSMRSDVELVMERLKSNDIDFVKRKMGIHDD